MSEENPTLEPTTVNLQDRFRGLMVGIAVGDALGRPVEGHRQVASSYLEEMSRRLPSHVYTDDTAMSIGLASSLLECDGFDGEHMARRFAADFFAEPWRGYGSGVVDVFGRVRSGIPWDVAAGMQFDGAGSYGNGAAMRVAPVAAWSYPDRDETIDLARKTARLTHTHPVGVEGAAVIALTAHQALGDVFDEDALVADLDQLIETDQFRARFKRFPKALAIDDDEYARLQLGNWVAADRSALTGVYCYLQASGFEDAMVRAIRIGGDTDTIAAMTGALAGARWGLSSIPDRWHGVEGYEDLAALADRCFARIAPSATPEKTGTESVCPTDGEGSPELASEDSVSSPQRQMQSNLEDRFRGMMVGVAVGDCLGRPIEGARFVSPTYIEEIIQMRRTLLYSDDTIQTMALADSLLACKGFSGEDFSRRMVDAWHQDPERGYGSNVVLAFGKVLRGMPWDEAAQSQFGGSGSYGNGGAMRVGPVALWAYPDLDETVRLATETARVTHTHPVGVEGAIIQAVAAHHALREPFSTEALLADLHRLVETERFIAKLDALETALTDDADDDWIRAQLGNWVSADDSVPTALFCFLTADDFPTALTRAIGLGGDTDTIGAMVGALAGARWGYKSIPESWLNIEGRNRLADLASRLYSRLGYAPD
ncbi:MAG: ADP-ribosylglycohydrolase family protein [Acidimicrobiia bacterium]